MRCIASPLVSVSLAAVCWGGLLLGSPNTSLAAATAAPVAPTAVAVSASTPAAGLAQAPRATVEPLFADFVRASQGQAHLIEPTAEALVQLSLAHPTDVVLMAYAGGATALRATTTYLPWKKMAFADDGLARLDKSLAMLTPAHAAAGYRGTPAVLEVKFNAANTFLALPGFFNRHERGAKLLAEVAASPLLVGAPGPFQAAVAAAQKRAAAQ